MAVAPYPKPPSPPPDRTSDSPRSTPRTLPSSNTRVPAPPPSPAPSTIARRPASDPKICFDSSPNCRRAHRGGAPPTVVSARTRPATYSADLEEPVEMAPDWARFLPRRPAPAPEDLGFADNHRVEGPLATWLVRHSFAIPTNVAIGRRILGQPSAQRVPDRFRIASPSPSTRWPGTPCGCTRGDQHLRARRSRSTSATTRAASDGR